MSLEKLFKKKKELNRTVFSHDYNTSVLHTDTISAYLHCVLLNMKNNSTTEQDEESSQPGPSEILISSSGLIK